MANAGSKVARLIAVLISALIGVAIGVVLLVVDTALLLKIIFIILGIFTVISTLPGFITAIKNAKAKYGVLNIVLTAISLTLGVIMIFAQQYVVWIVAAYLLVFPIIRIVLAKDHFAQTRREAMLLILGIVMILVGFGTLVDVMFVVGGYVIIGLSALYLILGAISALKD